MNLAEIAPTKTNLLEFKQQLEFSVEGHDLLEEKREVLVMHLIDILEEVKEKRKLFEEKLKNLYYKFKLLKLEFGEIGLKKISLNNIGRIGRVKITEKSIMGVNLPAIRMESEELKKRLFFDILTGIDRVSFYDEFIKEWDEFFKLLLEVAELEAQAWRLAYEIKKTQRKVNALENIFIPEFKEVIKFIQDSLEEREREAFFQMKRVKSSKEREEERRLG